MNERKKEWITIPRCKYILTCLVQEKKNDSPIELGVWPGIPRCKYILMCLVQQKKNDSPIELGVWPPTVTSYRRRHNNSCWRSGKWCVRSGRKMDFIMSRVHIKWVLLRRRACLRVWLRVSTYMFKAQVLLTCIRTYLPTMYSDSTTRAWPAGTADSTGSCTHPASCKQVSAYQQRSPQNRI